MRRGAFDRSVTAAVSAVQGSDLLRLKPSEESAGRCGSPEEPKFTEELSRGISKPRDLSNAKRRGEIL